MSASSKKKLRKEHSAEGLTEKQLAERKETKKVKLYTITFVVIMALIVVIALGTVIGRGIITSGIIERSTTAVTIGDHSLNSAELGYYYVDSVNATYSQWYSAYGDYAAYYMQMFGGLDLTQPLSSQVYDETTGESWADFYVDSAISSAQSTYALCDEAAANGYTLPEDEQATVDDGIENMRLYATIYGYKDLTAYLKAMYGYGATEESYRTYCEASALATSYSNAYFSSLEYDDETIQAYNADHALEYNSYSYAYCYLPSTYFLEGGTVDEDGTVTYSDEEKAASLKAAEEAANSLLDAASVVDFDKIILQMGLDSLTESTKNENLLYTSISSTFQEWLADTGREPGDITVIANESTTTAEDGSETTTTNGYYVLYFEGSTDNTFPLVNIRHILVSFEGGTTDDTGATVYSDEEKQAALDAATELLAQWQSGEATEDSFAALANENSDDTGSNTNGGLYENVYPGQMVTNFNDWCFDESRQPGDTDVVETEYGYHVMYFAGYSDTSYRTYMITNQLRSDEYTDWYNALVDAVTVTEGNTSKLNKDLVLLASS